MPLFTRCNISLRFPECVCEFIFEWKEKYAVVLHVSLNANKMLLPPHFPEEEGSQIASLPKTKTYVLF